MGLAALAGDYVLADSIGDEHDIFWSFENACMTQVWSGDLRRVETLDSRLRAKR